MVNDSADVTTRLSTAFEATIESGVYVEALFFYNNILFEVTEINVTKSNVCSTAIEDSAVPDLFLPIQVVQNLVQQFGQ